jgi:two-component system, OmpR family, sensor kinase
MNRFSLRTRLVAVAVLLVAFAVGATASATYAALRGFLYDRLDDQVAAASQGPSTVCYTGRGGLPMGGAYVAKLDSDGDVLGVTCSTGELIQTLLDPDADDAHALVTTPGVVRTIRSTAGAEYRAVALPRNNRVDPVGVAWSVIALPTSDVRGTLNKLLGLELLVGAVAVAGTAILGAVGVQLGMRPLYRVTRTARTVAAELGPDGRGLENRVPYAHPHTEVGQLAEAVNTMLGAVEQEYTARYESEQRMRRFLADASHELRTPLTSLRGYAELVRMRGGLDEDASDSLRRIETEGKRMGGLVDDLLTLARSDRGTVAEKIPVDVAEVVDDAVAGLRAAYPDRMVEVTARDALPAMGDRNQLLQVITNILTNAAVHATAPVPITVTAAREGDRIVVRVADGGPGLAPEQAAQVFDRFWRADAARTRVRGGSGLGLSIVQALVEGHGGEVRLESALATGTTVTITLPVAPAEVLGDAPAAAFAPPAPAL